MIARKPALTARAMQEYFRERLETCDIWPRLISLNPAVKVAPTSPLSDPTRARYAYLGLLHNEFVHKTALGQDCRIPTARDTRSGENRSAWKMCILRGVSGARFAVGIPPGAGIIHMRQRGVAALSVGGRKTMRKTIGILAIALLALSLGAGWNYAQQAGAAAPAPARAAAPPPPPGLLFRMTLENDTRLPLGQDRVTTPDVELGLYGDGKDILIAVGKGPNAPRTFDGLCDRPCGLTLRDRNNYFDLRGRANIKFTTIVSGFHRVRPLIRLADGTLLIGDQAEGSTADWHEYEISFSEVRWLQLDPQRGVTLGETWVNNPDLSKVDEVGYFDILPGSGVRVEGMPVEKMPPPPGGGWIAVSSFELWGKPVPREAKVSP